MDDIQRCRQCNAPLTGQVVGGLCGNCLLKLALEPPGELTAGPDERPQPETEPSRIRSFGDYELVEEIARGGMGVVYRARQISLNRIVAVKMILGGDFSSAAMVERFQTEAESAAGLDHPNIVPIHEIGIHEGQHYFSMRYVEGGSLGQAMASTRFSPRRATELMLKVAQAIHHAHQHGILHRDLKPGNILLDQAGEPHVADFGLAKVLGYDNSLTLSAAVMGTPVYMAPEQAAGQTKQATTAVDIYSLGAVFYEMLTGRPPFVGATALEVLVHAREREAVPPQALNPEVDRDLAVICLKCLEKNPLHRYGSAEALAGDFQRWLNQEPIQARRATVPERTWKWARRNPVVAGLLAAVLLMGVAGIIGILWQFDRANTLASWATAEAKRATLEAGNARQASTRAENELWNANFNEARALRIAGGTGARVQSSVLVRKLRLHPSLTEPQILALRAEAIAQMAMMDVALPDTWLISDFGPLGWNGSFDRFARAVSADRLEICAYPSEQVLASFPAPSDARLEEIVLSLDNQFLAARFGTRPSEVYAWNVATQKPIFRGSGIISIGISPDSQTLILHTTDGVDLISLTSATVRSLEPRQAARWAAFSPDSSLLAVLPDTAEDIVAIHAADSGQFRGSFSVAFEAHRVVWHPDGNRLVVGGEGGKLEVWTLAKEVTSLQCAHSPFSLKGHTNFIDRILVPSDGRLVITDSYDYSSIVWDWVTGRPLLREERLAIGRINASGDQAIGYRAFPSAATVATLLKPSGYRAVAAAADVRSAYGVWISPDSRLIAVTYAAPMAGGLCLLWDFARGVEIARLSGLWAQFSADSNSLFVFAGPEKNQVTRYDVSAENLAESADLAGEGTLFYEGEYGMKANTGTIARDTLAIAAVSGTVFLDTLGREAPRYWSGPAHGVSVSYDGKYVATSYHNTPTRLRTTPAGSVVLTAEINTQLKFSPDNRWLAAATPTHVQIYDQATLTPAYAPLPINVGHSTPPSFEFSPDGLTFAVCHDRNQVRLHESSSGRELATFTPANSAPINGAEALKFSADGQWLLAARNNGETVAWNIGVVRAELATLNLDWEVTSPPHPPGAVNRTRSAPDFSFRCPPRDSDAPRELIDLSRHYNAALTGGWHPGRTGAVRSDFAELPQGVQSFAGVPFDVRGLIQLGSRSQWMLTYPRTVPDIVLERACPRLHFLHAAVFGAGVEIGQTIGHYAVHYRDGTTRQIPIVLGHDVADWFSQPDEPPGSLVVAWTGANDESRAQATTIRLFKTTWQNPAPGVAIQRIDFVSNDEKAVPFLVAITAE